MIESVKEPISFKTTADIKDIADWFILKENMSNKKVQKLCYYAEAWCQALYNQSISENAQFEAWVHGPVSKVLWDTFRGYGWQPFKITNPREVKDRLNKILCEQQIDILESVWDTYGEYSADELEMLTHQEKPWLEMRKGLSPYESGSNVISTRTMREYYGSRLVN